MRRLFFLACLFLFNSSVMLPQVKTPAPAPAAPVPPAAAAQPAAQPSKDALNAASELGKLQAEQEKITKAQEVVREWFRRWSALDGSEESINRFVDLYRPDAFHLEGPRGNQFGPSTFQGQDAIRKMTESVSRSYSRLYYFILTRTIDEKTSELMSAGSSAWGGVNVAVEFSGYYDDRQSKKRITALGGAFFEIVDGKIGRLRIYHANGESAKVTGRLDL